MAIPIIFHVVVMLPDLTGKVSAPSKNILPLTSLVKPFFLTEAIFLKKLVKHLFNDNFGNSKNILDSEEGGEASETTFLAGPLYF
jgi:hypothetical protein